MKSTFRVWNREQHRRQKQVNGICRFCISDGAKIKLNVSSSEYGPDVLWCPKCGAVANWWLQTEYHIQRMLEAYDRKNKPKTR